MDLRSDCVEPRGKKAADKAWDDLVALERVSASSTSANIVDCTPLVFKSKEDANVRRELQLGLGRLIAPRNSSSTGIQTPAQAQAEQSEMSQSLADFIAVASSYHCRSVPQVVGLLLTKGLPKDIAGGLREWFSGWEPNYAVIGSRQEGVLATLKTSMDIWAKRPGNKAMDKSTIGLFTHVAAIVMRHPESWLGRVMRSDKVIRASFVPSLLGDVTSSIQQALAASNTMYDNITWYRCPRGHPYTVGNCGKPMVTSVCTAPGCGAIIGGADHTSSKGNTLMNAPANKTGIHEGYDISTTDHYDVSTRSDLDPVSCGLVRLLLHLTLFLAGNDNVSRARISNESKSFFENQKLTPDRILRRIQMDLTHLAKTTKLPPSNLLVFIHMVFDAFDKACASQDFPVRLQDEHTRQVWERRFLKMVRDLTGDFDNKVTANEIAKVLHSRRSRRSRQNPRLLLLVLRTHFTFHRT